MTTHSGGTTDNAPRGEGLCECGCGNPAPIAKVTRTERGQVKGQPVRFIAGHNNRGMDRSGPRKVHYVEEDRGYITPCWIWQLRLTLPNHRSDGGYGKLRHKGREYLAHRFYYQQAKGPVPEGLELDHLCRVRSCVNPDHLEPVTRLENMRRSGSSKLTIEQAREIERLCAQGLSSYKIAPMFGISRQTVDLIRKNGADGPRLPGR
jgi:hypothetical protein